MQKGREKDEEVKERGRRGKKTGERNSQTRRLKGARDVKKRHNVRILGERRPRKFESNGEREREKRERELESQREKREVERESGHSSMPLETDAV